MDRRKHRRIPARLMGSLLGNSHEVDGRTVDLSLGGAKIESALNVHPGKVIVVRLALPGAETIAIEEALVRWVGQWQFGVEFQNLDQGEVDELAQLIEEYDDAEDTGHA
ncbi:MAG TPA: PilZ domain-containing protein [Nitrospira sp.]|nr:PilZ domain-containing protein [Nitrospira sp.]